MDLASELPPANKKYHLVEVSYLGSNDDDDHQYQMMMTGEELAKAEKLGEKEVGSYWFYHSSISCSCEVTKAEFERFRSKLGGIGSDYILGGEYIDDLEEDEKADLKKEIKERKEKYYLVDVTFRPLPESTKEEVSYKMMLTDEEVEAWKIVKEKEWDITRSGEKDSDEECDDDDCDDDDEGFTINVVEDVTKEEYERFHKELSGLNSRWISSLIQRALEPKKSKKSKKSKK